MNLYYVSSDDHKTGKHKVHKLGCDHFPLVYIYLGVVPTQKEALKKAQAYFPKVELCPECCSPRQRRVFFNPS